MTAGLTALDNDRIRPHAHQFFRDSEHGREAYHARAAVIDLLDRRPAHDGKIGAKKGAAPRPQPIEPGAPQASLAAWRAHRLAGKRFAFPGRSPEPALRAIGRGQCLVHPGSSSPYAVCKARSASSVY